ncbi:hypothetical protein D043_3564A, partial [Vibrio parahaemolyticus EKP-021]
MSVTTSIW